MRTVTHLPSPPSPTLLRCMVFAIGVFALIGCANLETVRDFAKQSAALTAGPEIIDYWGSWNERSKRFDTAIAKLPPRNGDPPRGPTSPLSVPTKEELEAVKALQAVLSAYMSKLGSLADDNLTDVSKQVDGLVENLNKLPGDSSEEKRKARNSAYGAIIKLVKLPLEAYRHYEVQKLIRENDDNIQLLTVMVSRGLTTPADENLRRVDGQ